MTATMLSEPMDLPKERNLSLAAVAAIIAFGGVAALILLAAPVIAVQLGGAFNLTPGQIGLFFTTELGAMSLATIPSYWWLPRFSSRAAARTAVAVMILGNVASCFIHVFGLLLAARFITGLGGGSLMILCMTAAGAAPNKDRLFGLWVVGQLVLGAIALKVLPALFQHFGLAALFGGIAIIMFLLLPLAGALPSVGAARLEAGRASGGSSKLVLAVLGILAVLAFYISLGGVWTFIGGIAAKSGISAGDTGQVLSIATLFGIGGAVTASAIGNRFFRLAMIVLGYAIMIGAIALLLGGPTVLRFSVAAYSFKAAWTFVLPFILASISLLDRSGRLITTVNLVIGAGLAVGPGIAGWIIQTTGGFQQMLIAAVATGVVSFLLILPVSLFGSKT
jgi:MFS family permease